MFSNAHPLFSMLLCSSLSGCLPYNPGLAVVKPASAHGTWTGTLVPVDLYGKDARPVDAVAIRIDGGTEFRRLKYASTSAPIGQEAILVERSRKVLDRRRFEMGTRVEVTGLMKVDWVKDRAGTSVTHEPNGPAWHYHSVNPERLRRLDAPDNGLRPTGDAVR